MNEKKTPKKRPLITFWKKHTKEIKLTTGIFGLTGFAIATILGVRYYWNITAFDRWLSNAPLNELNEARETLHSEYRRHRVNDSHRESLWNNISRIDRRIREISSKEKSSSPVYHREHGTNLYKPD